MSLFTKNCPKNDIRVGISQSAKPTDLCNEIHQFSIQMKTYKSLKILQLTKNNLQFREIITKESRDTDLISLKMLNSLNNRTSFTRLLENKETEGDFRTN